MSNSETWGTLTIGGISAVGQYIERLRELEAENAALKAEIDLLREHRRPNDPTSDVPRKSPVNYPCYICQQDILFGVANGWYIHDEKGYAHRSCYEETLGKPGESGSQAGVRSET